MSEINWSELKKSADDATKPAPDGEYDLECVKAEAGNAASSGNPKIGAQLKIVGGPCNGKNLLHTFNLTPDSGIALSFFFSAMEAFGLDGNFFNQSPSMAQVAAALVGRKVHAKVGHREWQGQVRNNIESFSIAAGGPGAGTFGVMPGVPAGVPSTTAQPGVPTGVPNAAVPSGVPAATTSDMPKTTSEPPLPF